MRTVALFAALLLLAGCSQPTSEPDGDESAPAPNSSQAESTPAAEPEASPSESAASEPASEAAPAVAPSVEGEWKSVDTGPMTTEEEIDATDLPSALKEYLKSALMEEIIANEEWAEEFPGCPVEAQITALHTAGFAVGMVQGCGPDGLMGVFKDDGGTWRDSVMTGNEVPACADLAAEGVPADVPYEWDEGFRCQDAGANWRYW